MKVSADLLNRWKKRKEDAEASRDMQWAQGDRAFAQMNDTRAATIGEMLDDIETSARKG